VARLARHPLYRALRLDKLALAALHATLLLHRAGRHDAIPTLAMLRARPTEVRQKADRLKIALAELWPALRVLRVQGRAGGGALPERPFPSYAVEIMGLPAEDLARALREGDPPVVGRVHHDALLLDPRTLLDGDEPLLLDAFQKALSRLGPSGGREAPEATAPDLPEDPGA
jgi:L-seryl-tRNA(Ser) seleniumtransferase